LDLLEIVRSLFTALNAAGISYLHWKSNEHLPAALRGETDLDLLVDPEDRARFEQVLREHRFVRMLPPKARAIPGLDSHLGFDRATGALVHLDVHYRLILGEQLIKNHHLPLETWLLDDPTEMGGVHIPRAEREFMLLYIRSMLKTTGRQLARSIVKGGSPLPDRILKETHWLAERVDPDLLPTTAESSGLGIDGPEMLEFLDRARQDGLDWRYVRDRKRSLRRRLRRHERLPRYQALPKRVLLRLRSRPWARRLGLGLPARHLRGEAPLIAAIGPDGSGKTRLSRDLVAWLGWKLAVRHVYFGQPKGGLVFKGLNKPGSVARHRSPDAYPPPGLFGTVVRVSDTAKWLVLAGRRRRLAGSARSACRSGLVVIAERYPLQDFQVMVAPMDGPRLQDSPGALASLEMRQYQAIGPPDLLLVLNTDLGILRERKVDLTVEEHIAKVEAVDTLAPGPGRVFIDAGRPYESVLLAAKRAIWEVLAETR
jgi:hypothetical protein